MSAFNDPSHTLGHELRTSDSGLQQQFKSSLGEMVSSQAQAASAVVASVDRVNEGIRSFSSAMDDLGSAFGALAGVVDSGFADLSYQMRMQSQQLQQIVEVLQAPLDVQSRELRKRAQEAYAAGWYDDAETDFERSAELNRYDFTIHQYLGNIDFFHRNAPEAAREHYERAAKYAAPKSAFDASIAHLSLAAVAEVLGDPPRALAEAVEAQKASPELPEAHYAVAKYEVFAGAANADTGQRLLYAFRRKVGLTLTADADRVLAARRDIVDEALATYRDELRVTAAGLRDRLVSALRGLSLAASSDSTKQINDALEAGSGTVSRADQLIARDSILDLYEAIGLIRERAPQHMRAIAESASSAAAGQRGRDSQANWQAQGQSQKIASSRVGWGVGGAVVGAVLGWSASNFGGCFSGVIVGFVVGLLLNVVIASQAKSATVHPELVAHFEQLAQSAQAELGRMR